MTNMENLDRQLGEKERQQRVYEEAMAKLNHMRQTQEGEGLTLMFAWDAFGEAAAETSIIGKAAKGAEMFCIGFACAAPVLLFWAYVL